MRQPLTDRPAGFYASGTGHKCVPLHGKIITARTADDFTVYLQPVSLCVGNDFEQAVMASQVPMQIYPAI